MFVLGRQWKKNKMGKEMSPICTDKIFLHELRQPVSYAGLNAILFVGHGRLFEFNIPVLCSRTEKKLVEMVP
jgi:hypothetical protein